MNRNKFSSRFFAILIALVMILGAFASPVLQSGGIVQADEEMAVDETPANDTGEAEDNQDAVTPEESGEADDMALDNDSEAADSGEASDSDAMDSDAVNPEENDNEDTQNIEETEENTEIRPNITTVIDRGESVSAPAMRGSIKYPTIDSWETLGKAIAEADPGEVITIDANIYAEDTIVVDKAVTIKGKAKADPNDPPYYIYQKKRDSGEYQTMFKVTGNNGNLTLGENLVLSGKVAKCQGGTNEFKVTWSNGVSGTSEKKKEQTLASTDFDKKLYQNPGTDWSPGNGFMFNGWKWKDASGSTGSVEGLTAFETNLQIPSGTNGDAKIVAQWVKKDFKVIWSNGVSGDGEKTETWSLYDATSPKQVGTPLSFTPPDTWKPSNEYRFAGWTYRLSGDTTDRKTSGDNKANIVDGSGNPVKVTTDSVEMKIVAIWEKDAPSTNKYIENGANRLVYDTGGRLLLQASSGETDTTKYVVIKSIDSNGVITVNVSGVTGDQYIECQGGNVKLTNNTDSSDLVKAHSDTDGDSGTPATMSSDPIYLYSPRWPKGYLSYGTSWSTGTAMAFTLTPAPAGSGGGSSTETYSTTITPSYSTPAPEVYSSSVEPTYNTSPPGPQTCDGPECAGAETYTKDTFASGKFSHDNEASSEPHGFFVQVEGGAKATLDGATLEDFITSRDKDKSPKNVAPVTVIGANSRFDVASGTIRNNIVGYVVIDGEANKNANSIKMYVKGAAPNASRIPKSVRRNTQAGIDNNDPASGVMGTAGAIIYSDGTKGDIKGGSIEFNRGDTGGIMATGTNTVVNLQPERDSFDGANINNNVGVQFGGGVTTENDAQINMFGGTISENVAWFGGGAVFATENGTEWLRGNIAIGNRKDGKFVMNGSGVIDSNTAFTRGGGFLVDSDGVSLIKGTVSNNMSRMIGGGMYVMGDHKDFTYTVFINQGYVHDNKAVSAGQPSQVATDPDNQIVSRKLVPPNGCAGVTDLFSGQMEVNSDDTKDGYPRSPNEGSDGTGGGIWLCAYGNTVLGLEDDQFIIDHNYATGSILRGKATQPNQVPEDGSSNKAGGNDIHKETKGPGSIVITGVTSGDVEWYDENNGEWYTDPAKADPDKKSITDFSVKNLTNVGDNTPSGYSPDSYDGVDVFGNISRRGGGLAADGTFMFGKTDAIGDAYSELAITKTWADGVTPEDVKIRVNLEYKDSSGAEKKIEVIDLLLSDVLGDDSELGTTFTEGQYEDSQGRTVYKGHIVLPITVDDENGKPVQLFDLLSDTDGTVFPMTTASGLLALAEYLEGGGSVTLSNKERKLTFVELVKKGEEWVASEEFEITPTAMRLSTSPAPTFRRETVYQLQTDGTQKPVGTVIYSDVYFEADLVNDKPSEIEKYINKAVHKDIALNDEFEYDIMAYVKHGTDKLVITDKLIDTLAFVSTASEVKVVSLDDNNSKPYNDIGGSPISGNGDATVVAAGDDFDGEVVEIDDAENQLTVTIENKLEELKDATGKVIGYKNADTEQYLTALWGKWVRVTYKAQINPEIKAKIESGEMTIEDLASEYVTVKHDEKFKSENSIFDKDGEYRPEPNVGNNPVKSEEDHTGLENTASYSLEVKNEPAFRDESNTVTVKPEKPEIEKFVNKDVHSDIFVDDVFTYDILAYVTKDADRVEITDTLVSDLEFVSTASNVSVVSLGKATDDNVDHKPDGESVNAAGEPIDEKLVEIKEGKTLSVILDDKVKVNPSTGEITREGNTVKNLRGCWIKVTFQAQIEESKRKRIAAGEDPKSVLEYATIVDTDEEKRTKPNCGNDPVLSDLNHTGVPNKAEYDIEVQNESKYKDESNTVTVKPEGPEIEKYINQAVHKDIKLDEVFTYDIIAYITKDADSVTITDELNDDLQFVGGESDVEITNLGEKDNHKVTNNIKAEKVNDNATVAEAGEALSTDVTVKMNKGLLSVEIPDASSIRGNWIRVRFQCRIKEGKTVNDLTYVTVKPDVAYEDPISKGERAEPNIGNAPVDSNEEHTGVPNTASYEIVVGTEPRYKDTSNTVTVEPKEEQVYFEVEKDWDEYRNDKSKRPESITINLLADGEKVDSVTITKRDDWKGSFDGMPKFDADGNEIEYTVEEEHVDYYYYDYFLTDETFEVANHTRPWIPKIPSTPGNVGEITVAKTVSGAAEKNKAYDIVVKFTYEDGSTYTHNLSIKPTDEAFTFDYVPAGTKVEISEKTTGYDMTCKVDGTRKTDFKVKVGKTHEVVVNNDKSDKSKTPKTGDGTNILIWACLLVLAGSVFLTAVRTKKNHK